MAPTQTGSAPGKSPGLTLNLSSNNPFRNRATSPSPSAISSTLSPPATSPFDDPNPRQQRPVSRNPFLDPNYSSSQPNLIDTSDMSVKFESKASPTAEELFDQLILDDTRPKRPEGAPPRPPTNRPPGPPGRDNMPPPGRRGPPPPGHRPTRSQEEALRAKKAQMQGGPRPGPSAASPQRRPDRRPRRNSESSVLELDKPISPEELKAREARRREREKRHRGERDGKEKKPSRRLDIIDQLDHTSLFGGGFHHDGPFDAVASHRNRKGSRRAPMQAFPKDSLNMSLGGSGPLNRQVDQATLMGNNTAEAFKEYSSGAIAKTATPVFDPRGRSAVLHGEESLGLGTSTFLEGTPAARTAIQKREAEQAAQSAATDLQRKKSLAHRIRNINRGGGPSGRMTNPEGVYSTRSPRSPEGSGERNPFFNEYSKEPESLSIRRTDTRSPTSPPPPVPRRGSDTVAPLERRVTSDALSSPTEETSKPSGGFMSRVKSLKGGRRNRQPAEGMAPGTAV